MMYIPEYDIIKSARHLKNSFQCPFADQDECFGWCIIKVEVENIF